MRLRALYIAVFAILHWANYVDAQDSSVLHMKGEWLTIKEGLSQGMVSSIVQDRQGYIWFATKDGLDKYDSYKITVLKNDPADPFSLPDNFVRQLVIDSSGNFWVGTQHRGLFLFDTKLERFYPVPLGNDTDSLLNDPITKIACIESKLFVVKESDVKIYDVSGISPGNYDRLSKQPPRLLFSYNHQQQINKYQFNGRNALFSIMPDKSLWIDAMDTIFHYIPNPSCTQWTIEGFDKAYFGFKNKGQPYLYFSKPLGFNFILIGSSALLCAYDYSNRSIIYQKTLLKDEPLSFSMNIDARAKKTYLKYNNSTLLFDPANKLYQRLMVDDNSGDLRAYSLPYTDQNNISWFGTAGFGVFKNDSRREKFHTIKTTVGLDALDAVFSDRITAQIKAAKKQNVFPGIRLDNEGNLWLILYDENNKECKLARLDKHSNSLQVLPFQQANYDYVSKLFTDRSDRLWLFVKESVDKLTIFRINKKTGNTEASYRIPVQNDFNEYCFISDTWQDAHGIFWFGTMQGLFSFNEKTNQWKQWKNIPGDNSSLSENVIFSICPDPAEPDKYLWIGTNSGGLNRFDYITEKCTRYSEKDGLPNNVVYGILGDNAHNLWMSTNKGLSCFTPSTRIFRNFTEEDGLPGDEFNRYEYWKLNNGNLVFGGVNGYTSFNPADVLIKQPAVPIVFTELSISNKVVSWKTDSTIIDAPISYAQTITLHPGENIFTISFASLEYRSNQKKLYKYRLEGFNNNWITPSSKNEATFTNLSPGTYTFYVTGTNSDGIWNEKGISIRIIVLPYWYQTWLFKVMIILACLLLLYGLYRYRIQQLLKLERLRNRIAIDLHDEIGSSLSSISLYGESAKKLIKGDNAAGNVLSKITTTTSEMMEAMSDIVWAINTRNDRFDNMANRMRSYAVQVTEARGMKLHFTDNSEIPSMPLDMEQRKNMYLLFKEAVNNAVKYAEAKNLWVSFSIHKHILEMIIRDDGKGFTLNENFRKTMGGNGITNMFNRAEEMKADLEILPVEGQGTTIKLKVSLKKS